MAKSKVKVLVACGSGVATSTVAKNAVADIAADAGVPVEIYKATIAEVPVKQHDVDVVLTTSNYRKPLEKPYLSVFPLIAGIGADGCKKKLAELLQKVLKED